MAIKRTKPPENYIEPNDVEIREMAQKVGLKTYSPELVRDIANMSAGGEFTEYTDISNQVKAQVSKSIKRDEYGYYKYHPYGEYTSETNNLQKALDAEYEFQMKRTQAVCEFMRDLSYCSAPGSTPLEKSVGILNTLYNASADHYGEPISDGTGESLPIFGADKTKSDADRVNDLNETIETLNDEELDLIEEDIESGQGLNIQGDSGLRDIAIASDMAKGKEWFIKISRNLDSITRFKLGKTNKKSPDIEGDDVHKRPIKGFSEYAKLPKKMHVLPKTYGLYKVSQKSVYVKERVSREDKKQLIYMLIDSSYSMIYKQSEKRQYKAGGVLMNRLKSVLKEQCELYFRFFDSRVFEEHHVKTPTEARGAMNKFGQKAYNGTSTDIVGAIRKSIERIEELTKSGKMDTKPELVVVTDGDDDCSILNANELRAVNIKLHVFIVGSKGNEHLKTIARNSGGVAVSDL